MTESTSSSIKTLLIGLSGPSSSGKTTLARLLRSIFNITASPSTHNRSVNLFILHEDDFYKTDTDIPVVKLPNQNPSGVGAREVQDWDCIESLNLPLFTSTLQHVKSTGYLPPDSFSKEDQNSVGPSSVSPSLISSLHTRLQDHLSNPPTSSLPADTELRICVLDGFLLYPSPKSTNPLDKQLYDLSHLYDLKLFVTCSRKQTIERRTKRTGYVTLEGFWEDPEGYVEDVVWPNFVRDHAWLCRDEGEEGRLRVDEEAAKREEITVAEGNGEGGIEGLVEWGVRVLKKAVDGI